MFALHTTDVRGETFFGEDPWNPGKGPKLYTASAWKFSVVNATPVKRGKRLFSS